MSGTLQKMGRRLKRWTPRYFELQGSKLHYYRTPSKHEYLGAIDLKICYSATPSPIVSFGSTFELRTLDRVHILAARTHGSREEWISAIKEKMMPSKEKAEEKRKTLEPVPPKKWLSFRRNGDPPKQERGATAKVVRKESLMERLFTPKSRRKLSSDTEKNSLQTHTGVNLSVSTPSSPVGKRISLQGALSADEASPEPLSPSSTHEHNTDSFFSPSSPQSPATTSTPASPAAISSVFPPMVFPAATSLPSSAAVNELRELLNSLPESKMQQSYDGWPPLAGEETWMNQQTAIEQLRHFLASCP